MLVATKVIEVQDFLYLIMLRDLQRAFMYLFNQNKELIVKSLFIVIALLIGNSAIAGNASSGGDAPFRPDLICGEVGGIQVSIQNSSEDRSFVQLYVPTSPTYNYFDVTYGACEKLPGSTKVYLTCKIATEKTSYRVGLSFKIGTDLFASVTQGDDTHVVSNLKCAPFYSN